MGGPMDMKKLAGILLFLSSAQFILAMVISEALYDGYSTRNNYISDLGVGKTAVLFNGSVIVLGVLLVISAHLISQATKQKLFPLFLAITGIGAMGAGIFPESSGEIHTLFSAITFIFAGFTAISTYTLITRPARYFGIIFGIFMLVALILFATENYLGLGKGGMERMVAYPALLFSIFLGGYLGSQ